MTEYEWLTCEDYHAMIPHAPVLVSDVEGFGKTVRFSFANDDYVYHCDSSISICNLIREVVGNPFRPTQTSYYAYYFDGVNEGKANQAPESKEFLYPWLTPRVQSFAQGIVDSERYDDVSVLADLLEEAGCDNEEILRHFRQELRCPECFRVRNYCGFIEYHDCKTTGWLPKPVPCQAGCWALRLLTGG